MEKLALFGGTPVRTKPFPNWPKVTEELKKQVINTMETDLLGVGSNIIMQFEEKYAEFHDAKYGLSTSSGTTALWVCLKAAGVKAGDEVIIPPYTFIATGSSILMANAVPVFVDVDPETFNMDPTKLEAAITDKTKVIMPVHIAGNPAEMDAILQIAKKHNIEVIEDAAQAHGAEWDNKKVGALGLGGIFSFQSSKNLSAGEGGAIVSNDKNFMDACFSYANCGRVRGGKWYEHQHLGGNFRLNSMAASLLLAQLNTIERDMDLRDKNRTILDNAISEIDGLNITKMYPKTTRSANHLYLLRYNKDKFNGIHRDKFFKAMQAEGVYTYGGYTPLYRERLFAVDSGEYPWLENINYKDMNFPVTEKLCTEEAVWLRQNHLLGTKDDINDIIMTFKKVTTAMKENSSLF
ncbi:MAG: aminotransferase class I/II-fold pyridoxal phosphate-dependent enzyme [Planctomycetia bacterium]|nr:aminotransferase class I/II-fold pyridoxal phosphate-dependent enzyme [Planctomycetia bacterium]